MKYGSTEGQVALSNSTGVACGTLMNDPADGGVANVALIGVAKAKAGATIAKGDKLVSGVGYKAIPTTTTGDKYFGEALEGAATNDVFSYLVLRGIY